MYKNILLVPLIFLPTISFALTSKQYATLGAKAYAAFECSVYAYKFNDHKESDRLFKIGYKNALTFANAYKAKKITQDDMLFKSGDADESTTLDRAENAAFITGRIYEAAQTNAFKIMNKDLGLVGNRKKQEQRAAQVYQRSNCNVID